MNVSYSVWPGICIPYNFPPSMCMKQSNFILSLLIPGNPTNATPAVQLSQGNPTNAIPAVQPSRGNPINATLAVQPCQGNTVRAAPAIPPLHDELVIVSSILQSF